MRRNCWGFFKNLLQNYKNYAKNRFVFDIPDLASHNRLPYYHVCICIPSNARTTFQSCIITFSRHSCTTLIISVLRIVLLYVSSNRTKYFFWWRAMQRSKFIAPWRSPTTCLYTYHTISSASFTAIFYAQTSRVSPLSFYLNLNWFMRPSISRSTTASTEAKFIRTILNTTQIYNFLVRETPTSCIQRCTIPCTSRN